MNRLLKIKVCHALPSYPAWGRAGISPSLTTWKYSVAKTRWGLEKKWESIRLIYTRVPFSMWQPVIEGRVFASGQKGLECGSPVQSPGLSTQTYGARACGWISCISFMLLSLAMMLMVLSRTVCLGGKKPTKPMSIGFFASSPHFPTESI